MASFLCPECGSPAHVTGGGDTPKGYRRYRICQGKMCGICFATLTPYGGGQERFTHIPARAKTKDDRADIFWDWHWQLLQRKRRAPRGSPEKKAFTLLLKALKKAGEALEIR